MIGPKTPNYPLSESHGLSNQQSLLKTSNFVTDNNITVAPIDKVTENSEDVSKKCQYKSFNRYFQLGLRVYHLPKDAYYPAVSICLFKYKSTQISRIMRASPIANGIEDQEGP